MNAWRALPPGIRFAGDAALLMEVGPPTASPEDAFDEDINARAIAIAAALREAPPAGVRDVLPTFRSVAVHFDPLTTDIDLVVAWLTAAREAPAAVPARSVEIPVVYGGDEGPDLPDVAAFAGCAPADVIARHSASAYRVFMLGFLPGFPYLGPVDPTIGVPRRATPRMKVPAGSVGIAGLQTGVYPSESPGGWQIVGRTNLVLFDPLRPEPALLAPGDRVRFVPVREQGSRSPDSTHANPADTSGTITVIQPGLFTTVQDWGRWGMQSRGVSVSGPMDSGAHRLANALVGNRPDAAALEATLLGPELRFEQAAELAIAGADLGTTIDGMDLPMNTAVAVKAGSQLKCGQRRYGARAYVAFRGGIDVPPVLGSRATHVRSRLGGVGGRALKAGDHLSLGSPSSAIGWRGQVTRSTVTGGARLRVLPGPQVELCEPDALDVLQRGRFNVLPQSDRMGYRLSGSHKIGVRQQSEMVSDAAFAGGVQVPPSGDPILLMADRQTTGGYPQLAVVISADLPLAGQLVPGEWIEFQLCTYEEALAALREQEERFRDE